MDLNFFKLQLPPLPKFGPFGKRTDRIVNLINQYVCWNQGRYIQFEYLLGNRHRALKDELKKKSVDADKTYVACEELLRFMSSELKAISTFSFKFMLEYFNINRSSRYKPRVCVKGIDSHGNITDLFRDRRGAYHTSRHPIASNTGHENVAKSGIWYIENDIPAQAKMGIYTNHRLDDIAVRNYSESIKVRLNKEADDYRWMACWKKNNGTVASKESCYKSTMIIPMTLKQNQLSDEFSRDFFEDPDYVQDRMIWGFLCFDHPAKGFFCEQTDMKFGYVFADVLSLYYISAFIHSTKSSTFRTAIDTIGKNPDEWGELVCYQNPNNNKGLT